MSFDLDKLQAVAELGEVIRLQNEALERLQTFRKARPHMMMPNLAKMVEENIKDNVTVLYKELNNLHKPAEKQTRYVCNDCHMAFISPLPGGICDECRARRGSGGPRQYVPYQGASGDEEDDAAVAAQAVSADGADGMEGEAAPVQEAAAESPTRQASTGNVEDLYAAAIAAEPDADATEPSSAGGSVAEAASATDKTLSDDEPAEPASEPADERAETPAEAAAPEPEKRQRKPKPDAGDDFFDTPGDEVELANPAPEVAKPEGVEGIPDIVDDAGAGDRTT